MAGSNSAYRAVEVSNVVFVEGKTTEVCASKLWIPRLPHPLLNLPAQMADAFDVLPAQLATDLPLMRV